MSAFIVDPYHIRFLHTYASHHRVYTPRRADGSSYTETEAACLLWNQNVRSVAYRYSDCRPDELPGRIGYTAPVADDAIWRPLPWDSIEFTPGRVLGALACLEYQSCETPDYEETPAYAYLEAIRHEAIRHVEGCDGAWEIQEPVYAEV